LGIIVILLLFLSFGLVKYADVGLAQNQYHGQPRWVGAWGNPNFYGLLMGTGAILALGLLVQSLMSTRLCDATARRAVQGQMQKGRNWKLKRQGKIVIMLLSLFAAILMGRGLLHSYSRGAWVGVVCGLAYLFWSSVQSPPVFAVLRRGKKSEVQGHWIYWLKKNWLLFSVILASAFVLSFWQFRHTEWHPARRVFSSANVNDFSWRNRITAWEGEFQIMAEHPWLGAGWNKPEALYEHYYLLPKMEESGAIGLNDYLMLGATLGVPALFCFVTYIWLSLNQKSGVGIQMPKVGDRRDASPTLDFGLPPSLRFVAASWTLNWSRTVCRAGAIMLAVGFCFDGGLFNLPTASTFWILLGLGSVKLAQTKVADSESG
jgi:hypothetical protein